MSEDAPQSENDLPPAYLPGGPNVSQVIPTITPWFARAFLNHAQEEVTWEIGLLQFPTNTRGEFISLIGLFAAIPGAIIGTLVMANEQIQPYGLTEELVDTFVSKVLESLRTSRSGQLAEMEEASVQNARNGQAPPTNGIIIPGR